MKVALFAFNGEPMCFVHVLLHALDLAKGEHEVELVIEGSATALVQKLNDDPDAPFAGLYAKVRDQGLIASVCKACANKMGSAESAQQQGLTLNGELQGHPSIARYLEAGYKVLTF